MICGEMQYRLASKVASDSSCTRFPMKAMSDESRYRSSMVSGLTVNFFRRSDRSPWRILVGRE